MFRSYSYMCDCGKYKRGWIECQKFNPHTHMMRARLSKGMNTCTRVYDNWDNLMPVRDHRETYWCVNFLFVFWFFEPYTHVTIPLRVSCYSTCFFLWPFISHNDIHRRFSATNSTGRINLICMCVYVGRTLNILYTNNVQPEKYAIWDQFVMQINVCD